MEIVLWRLFSHKCFFRKCSVYVVPIQSSPQVSVDYSYAAADDIFRVKIDDPVEQIYDFKTMSAHDGGVVVVALTVQYAQLLCDIVEA